MTELPCGCASGKVKLFYTWATSNDSSEMNDGRVVAW